MTAPSAWFRRMSRLLASLAVAVLAVATPPAEAEDAAAFYKGQTVRLIVGYGAGGGYDAYARQLAPHLEKRLGATVVVENRTGAGGLLALNQLAAGEPDGLSIMLVNGEGAALAQLLGEEGVRYDLMKLPWLGRVSTEAGVVLLGPRLPYRTLADAAAATERIRWGAGGKTDSLGDRAAVLSHALGLNSKIILGYKGANEAALAAIQGEVDAIVVSAGTAGKFVRDGTMTAAAVMDRERSPLLPDVPTVFEAADLSPEAAWWLDFRAKVGEIGRALITTPGVPDDRVQFLRAVAAAMLADPAVVAEGDGTGRPIEYAAATELRELIRQTLETLDSAKLAEVRSVLLEKYY